MKQLMVFLALIVCSSAFGQRALTHYFGAGQTDANVLVKSYLAPMGEDLGTLASNGWYNTAATHKRFGFDISVSMNSVAIPTDRKSYLVPPLVNSEYQGSSNDKIPTVYGDKLNYPPFLLTSGPNAGHNFLGPDGIDPSKTYYANVQPLPTIQAGLGLFANTDIRLRYSPDIKVGDLKTGTIGGAIMHDIKQHIPGLKTLPFSMSILIGYTQVHGTVDLSGAYSGAGQEGKITSTATNAQLLISKSLSVVTFYGGLGYVSTTTKFNVNGTYHVDSGNGDINPLPWTAFDLTDPYKYSFKTSGFKATLGMRLKLGPLFLNGDYSFFNSQNLTTVGAGFTFH